MDLMSDFSLDLEEEVEQPVIVKEDEEHTLTTTDGPYDLPLRIDHFGEEKAFVKFVKCVEKLVRNSSEYKYWISYIIEHLGHNVCSLTNESTIECNIEIHHHPITLFTICKGVINSRINNEKKFCSFDIATEVIELHFQNKVGYVSLLSDLHKKYHDGYLELPVEIINGNYVDLINSLPLEQDERDKIMELCSVKAKDCVANWGKDNYPGILEASSGPQSKLEGPIVSDS